MLTNLQVSGAALLQSAVYGHIACDGFASGCRPVGDVEPDMEGKRLYPIEGAKIRQHFLTDARESHGDGY